MMRIQIAALFLLAVSCAAIAGATNATISISSSKLDMGQTMLINATVSESYPNTYNLPYSYGFVVMDASSNKVVFTHWQELQYSRSNTFIYQTNSTGSFFSNVIVRDASNSPASSFNSNVFTVSPALSTPVISPSAAVYDYGQAMDLNASWSGGTAPYAVAWYFRKTNPVILLQTPLHTTALTEPAIQYQSIKMSADTTASLSQIAQIRSPEWYLQQPPSPYILPHR